MAQVDRVAPFLGFIFGTPFLGPAFEAIFVLELASQAYSFYRWANCIPPDHILVNMDECSLAVHVEGCRGTVLRSVRGAVRASLSTQRSRMTLLASVSTDFGFNAILPQVIIANKTQFPIKFMKSLDPAITDRLKIWRGATAWNTAAFMCSYLRLLHERWQSYCPEAFDAPLRLCCMPPPFYCEVIGQNIGVAGPSGTGWCYRYTSTA